MKKLFFVTILSFSLVILLFHIKYTSYSLRLKSLFIVGHRQLYNLSHIESLLTKQAFKSDYIKDTLSQLLSLPMLNISLVPTIILGTAGTGTRVVASLYDLTNITNAQKDSLVFISLVKKSNGFIEAITNINEDLSSSIERMDKILKWEWALKVLRNQGFDNGEIDLVTIYDILKRSDLNKYQFGFKEPQASFVLPHLIKYYRNARVIHVIRDGRDVAFSKQQRQKYQLAYLEILAKNDVNCEDILKYMKSSTVWIHLYKACLKHFDSSLQFSLDTQHLNAFESLKHYVKVMKTWNSVNLNVKRFCDNNSDIEHHLVKLEEICPELTLGYVKPEKCRIGKYKGKNEGLIRLLEFYGKEALLEFSYVQNYSSNIVTNVTKSLQSSDFNFMFGDDLEFDKVIYTVVTKSYLDLFHNWYAFASQFNYPIVVLSTFPLKGLNVTNVIIVSRAVKKLEMGKYDIWKARMLFLNRIKFNEILMVDLDVLLLKDPFDLKGDVVAGRGRFPYELCGDAVEKCICMGFLLIKRQEFLKELAIYVDAWSDDQRGVNYLLRDSAIAYNKTKFEKSLESSSTADDYFFKEEDVLVSPINGTYNILINNSSLQVKVLSLLQIPRFCKQDFIARGREQVIGSAHALHCLTPKNGLKKEKFLRRWGLWKAANVSNDEII